MSVNELQYGQRDDPSHDHAAEAEGDDLTLPIAAFTLSIASARSCLVTSSFMMNSRAA
jgi:hypothetical protein